MASQPSGARLKAKQLYVAGELSDAEIDAECGLEPGTLRAWAKAEHWDRMRKAVDARVDARIVDAEVAKRLDAIGSDPTTRVIEAAIARFLREKIQGGSKLTAADLRALVSLTNDLQSAKSGRKKR